MTDPRTMRSLLRACRRGDDRAARSLHAHAHPILTACANAILRNRHDAEDAAQRAFLTLMRQPTRAIDRVEDPIAWLIAIARREAMMLARTTARARRREASTPPRRATPRDPTADHTHDLTPHIESLPRHLREVLTLRHIAGLTFDQIELATGINRNTASARHRRALEALREAMHSNTDAAAAPAPRPGHTSEAIHA